MKKILPDNHIRHLPQNQQYDNETEKWGVIAIIRQRQRGKYFAYIL